MKIEIVYLNGKKETVNDEYEIILNQSLTAACDSLTVGYRSKNKPDEIVSISAAENGKVVFFGYCDRQTINLIADGYDVQICARSSACVLVDCEAKPFTFNSPSANQLCRTFAYELGFSYSLKNITQADKYEVAKGTSCFGAINDFVRFTTNSRIYVTPENEIRQRTVSDYSTDLKKYNIIRASLITNRSEPLGNIRFKQLSGDDDYRLVSKSRLSDSLGFEKRKRYINLSSYSIWQRDNIILQKLKNSYSDYHMAEFIVTGYADDELCQKFKFRHGDSYFDDYILTSKKFVQNKSGSKTKLVLNENIDIKEFIYVD